MIYEFKITLTDVGVPVSRTLQIEKDTFFYEFHETLQVVFDWTNSHLFSFFMNVSDGKVQNKVTITLKESTMFQGPSGGSSCDVEEARLSDWFIWPKDKALYVYDFGDDWTHEIELVDIIDKQAGIEYPICTAAENFAPPEDSRFELLEGQLNLVAKNNEQLLREINNELDGYKSSTEYFFIDDEDEFIFAEENDAPTSTQEIIPPADITYNEIWEATLAQAKEFLQKKPWEELGEEDIFVVKEPEENTFLFCRVTGESGDDFGLEIYFGWEGFFALLERLSGNEIALDGMQHEQVLIMTFEDRTDLEKVEYNLIKTHSTTFRGKKSWPVFISYRPSFFPWQMDENEAEYVQLAMREVMQVLEEQAAGLEIPHIVDNEEILLREVDHTENDDKAFVSHIVDVEQLIEEEEEDEIVLSELELRRLSKMKEGLAVSIEFTILPLEMPLQDEDGGRVFFPFLSLAVDANSGEVYYHEISDSPITIYNSQQAFLRALDKLGGIPNEVMTDPLTARAILPYLDICDFNFSIEESLQMTTNVVEGLMEFMLDGFDGSD